MPSGADDHRRILSHLNESLQKYSEQFSEQFHLKIPKGAIKKVDFYRDHYFGYLKDSVYKSNICYLLQTIDFQIWLYQLFRPRLSVENTYFYQLTVSLGIVAEALASAILLNDFIEENPGDRSMGQVTEGHLHIRETVINSAFAENIKRIEKLQLLPADLIAELQDLRRNVRNQVHIQGWEGRLYQSLTYDWFDQKLRQFRAFLQKIPAAFKPLETPTELEVLLFGGTVDLERLYQGTIIAFNQKGGFGFIKTDDFDQQLYFHIASVTDKVAEDKLKGSAVQFKLRRGRKGIEAAEIACQT